MAATPWSTEDEETEFMYHYGIVADTLREAIGDDDSRSNKTFDALARMLGQANAWGQAKVRTEE
jgi:hypothetical protein